MDMKQGLPSLPLQELAQLQSDASGPSVRAQKDASMTGELRFCNLLPVLWMLWVTRLGAETLGEPQHQRFWMILAFDNWLTLRGDRY
jgi:hypothetical protein